MTGFPKEDIDVKSSMADRPDQGNADTGTGLLDKPQVDHLTHADRH